MARIQGPCHSCGTLVKAETVPNRRVADWRASNRVFTCDECREVLKRQRSEDARAWAVSCGLPALEGTAAQVEWAEILRQAILTVLLRAAAAVNTDDLTGSPLRIPADVTRPWDRLLLAADSIWHQSSAHWWIEKRSASPEALLRQVTIDALLPEQVEQVETDAALERAAEESTVVIPVGVELQSPLIVWINVHGQTILAILEDRIEAFRTTVKRLGYTWNSVQRRWQKTVDERNAPLSDRVVELSAELLREGFKVQLPDPEIRSRAIAGDYTPAHTRWLHVHANAGKYGGWISVQWSRAEDYYKRARALPGARYDTEHYCVVVPPAAWEALRDFAQLYDYRITPRAEQLLQQAENTDRSARLAKLERSVQAKSPQKDGLAEILTAPIEVPDDLRD